MEPFLAEIIHRLEYAGRSLKVNAEAYIYDAVTSLTMVTMCGLPALRMRVSRHQPEVARK